MVQFNYRTTPEAALIEINETIAYLTRRLELLDEDNQVSRAYLFGKLNGYESFKDYVRDLYITDSLNADMDSDKLDKKHS